MFVLGEASRNNCVPCGTDGFVSLKLLVSACLVLLHQVGPRVKLTLRRCHRTEFSVEHCQETWQDREEVLMLGKTELTTFTLGNTELRIFMLGKTEVKILMLSKTE